MPPPSPKDDSPQPYQRRIGQRHPIHVELEWGPIPQGRWRRKTQTWQVTTHDVSLSGFGFECDTHAEMGRGQPVVIRVGETTCGAIIRVAKPGRTDGLTYYGLEFHDEDMLGTVKDLIATHEASLRAET